MNKALELTQDCVAPKDYGVALRKAYTTIAKPILEHKDMIPVFQKLKDLFINADDMKRAKFSDMKAWNAACQGIAKDTYETIKEAIATLTDIDAGNFPAARGVVKQHTLDGTNKAGEAVQLIVSTAAEEYANTPTFRNVLKGSEEFEPNASAYCGEKMDFIFADEAGLLAFASGVRSFLTSRLPKIKRQRKQKPIEEEPIEKA